MKKIGAYIVSIAGVLALVIIAVFLPQIFFSVQDSYRTGETNLMSRDVYDIITAQTVYPLDVYTKLHNLAQTGLGDVSVSVVKSSIDIEEFYEIKDSIREQAYVMNLVTLLPETFGDSINLLSADNIKKCGKYIVYGDEYTNGVILMFWYMKIYLPSVNSYMELVIDSETNHIYYMEVEAQADITYSMEFEVKEEEAGVYVSDVMLSELEKSELVEMGQNAQISQSLYEVAETFPDYLESYYRSYYGVYQPLSIEEKDNLYSLVVGEDAVTIVCSMPFNENHFQSNTTGNATLFFRAYVEEGYGAGPDISIGIPIIRQLVIE